VLKSIFLTVVLFVAMTLLMAQTVFSSPLAEESQFLEVAEAHSLEQVNPQSPDAVDANPEVIEDVEKTADGEKVNLSKSPNKAPVVSTLRSTYPQPPHPYDYSKIEKFDEDLYGEGN
jgi:hypothetical protein